jgi:transposase
MSHERVTQLIESLVRYLPPYSPDFNPIELTFSVLKAWMKRNWVFLRQTCRTYGDFLALAIRESHCDRFTKTVSTCNVMLWLLVASVPQA